MASDGSWRSPPSPATHPTSAGTIWSIPRAPCTPSTRPWASRPPSTRAAAYSDTPVTARLSDSSGGPGASQECGSSSLWENPAMDRGGRATRPAEWSGLPRSGGPRIGRPFGFDFDRAGHLLVSDAALTTGQSGETSYDVARDGTFTANGPAVPIDPGRGVLTVRRRRLRLHREREQRLDRPLHRRSRRHPHRSREHAGREQPGLPPARRRRQRRPELPVRPGRRPVADRRLPDRPRWVAHPGDHRPSCRRLRRYRRHLNHRSQEPPAWEAQNPRLTLPGTPRLLAGSPLRARADLRAAPVVEVRGDGPP